VLNPVHLRTLAMVLRTGSFAEAARRLGYTGSAVSQQISTLERQVRTPLFERDAHSIRATPAAEFIAARSHAALGALEALEDDISLLMDGVVGRLRLGSFPTASERLLPDALSSFTASHPDIDVQLDEAEPQELVPLLESREIDLAVVYRYSLVPRAWPRTVLAHPVLREELLVVRAGDGSQPPGVIDLAELAGETWVSTREGTSGAAVLRHLCRARGFEPAVSYRSNNYSVIQGLVRAGLGVALVPALGHEPGPGLSAARIADSPAFREVLVAGSPTAPQPVVEAFIGSFRRAASRFAGDAVGVTQCVTEGHRQLPFGP
jgi:DNA-binding transcriptional LysR family regulator